jgi:hypothetical protein
MSSKSRRLKAVQPERSCRRGIARRSREWGLNRCQKSAARRRYRKEKRTMRRSSRFRERLGGPLYCTPADDDFPHVAGQYLACLRATLKEAECRFARVAAGERVQFDDREKAIRHHHRLTPSG